MQRMTYATLTKKVNDGIIDVQERSGCYAKVCFYNGRCRTIEITDWQAHAGAAAEALSTIRAMKISGNSIAINGYVVVRVGKNAWRLGEMAGDWLRIGTAEEIVERAYRL